MQSLNDVFLTKRECLKDGCKGIIVYDDVGNEFVLTTNQEFKNDAKFVLFSVSNFCGQLDGIAVVHDGANKPVVFQESENACNQAFEAFGVVRSKSLDEFDTLGLYKYFDNFDIVKSSKYLEEFERVVCGNAENSGHKTLTKVTDNGEISIDDTGTYIVFDETYTSEICRTRYMPIATLAFEWYANLINSNLSE